MDTSKVVAEGVALGWRMIGELNSTRGIMCRVTPVKRYGGNSIESLMAHLGVRGEGKSRELARGIHV